MAINTHYKAAVRISLGVIAAYIVIMLIWFRYFQSSTSLNMGQLADDIHHYINDQTVSDSFLKNKEQVKSKLEIALHLNGDKYSETYRNLYGLALYLFPEILDSDDYEKTIAQSQWVPEQKIIENSPHSKSSEQAYEHLAAAIYNYEVADKKNPILSDSASAVISLYGRLAKP